MYHTVKIKIAECKSSDLNKKLIWIIKSELYSNNNGIIHREIWYVKLTDFPCTLRVTWVSNGDSDTGSLYLEFSISGLLFGSNVKTPTSRDKDWLFQLIGEIADTVTSNRFVSKYWKLSRVDAFSDIIIQPPYKPHDILDALAQYNLTHNMPCRYAKENLETLHWKSSLFNVRMYDKEKEFKDKSKSFDKDLLRDSKGKLRLELQAIGYRQIMKFYGTDSFELIYDVNACRNALEYALAYIGLKNKFAHESFVEFHKSQVIELGGVRYRKLMEIIDSIKMYGKETTMRMYPEGTFYYYWKIICSEGVFSYICDMDIRQEFLKNVR